MSLFPRTFYNNSSSFTPLFRLLKDFNHVSRHSGGQRDGGKRLDGSFWQPKFDL